MPEEINLNIKHLKIVMVKSNYILELLRISIGIIFLWAFLDKVFGLGFSTPANKAWIYGNSPTLGFLKFGTHGPFAPIFQAIAGNPVVDFLFMFGLLFAGLFLIWGIFRKISAYGGAFMMFLIWLSGLPPKNNPFLDEHIIYILVLIGIAFTKAGHYLGLGKYWERTWLVRTFKFLE